MMKCTQPQAHPDRCGCYTQPDDASRDKFDAGWKACEVFMQPTIDSLREEIQHAASWRTVALQFDHHRMRAMGLLKMIANENDTNEAMLKMVNDFVNAPPVSGHVLTHYKQAVDEICKEGVGTVMHYLITMRAKQLAEGG